MDLITCQGTVHWRLALLFGVCGVPGAVAGSYILHNLGERLGPVFPLLMGGLLLLVAAAFANVCPERVERLALAAMVWTGEGSPTLKKRRERLEEWRSSSRRVVDLEFYKSIHNRDKPGLSDDAVPVAMAEAEKPFDGTVPTGTYVDMCAKLPLVALIRFNVRNDYPRGT